MNKSFSKRFWLIVFAIPVILAFLTHALSSMKVARAQSKCDPVYNPCTDTPYPPKVTDTYPPKLTYTETYPPKPTYTSTYPPKPTSTPTYPPKPSETRAGSQASDTPKPTVIYYTATSMATLTQTITNTATLKPTVLGATVTSSPTITSTFIPLIPFFAPTPTLQPLGVMPLPIGDIWVTGIEFTQAIQVYGTGTALDNSIPLVAGKKTIVRIYVQSDNYTAQWNNVTARLTVTGGREPGRILLPMTENSSSTIIVKSTGSNRARYNESFNFLLDQDETSAGTRHFSVEIFSMTRRLEFNTANNHREMDASFSPVPNISTMAVVYGNDGTDPAVAYLAAAPWSDFFRHVVVAENMAPVANFSLYYFPGLVLQRKVVIAGHLLVGKRHQTGHFPGCFARKTSQK